jgi:hypothetical protein
MSSATEKTREVTKLLADLDCYFSFSKNPQGGSVWQLVPFEVPDQKPVPVDLLLTDLWLYVYHLRQLNRRPEADILIDLLKLNGMTSGAKVGWLHSPVISEPGRISVTAEIWTARVSIESLREAIGAVVYVSQEVRKIIPPELVI